MIHVAESSKIITEVGLEALFDTGEMYHSGFVDKLLCGLILSKQTFPTEIHEVLYRSADVWSGNVDKAYLVL